MRRLLHLAPVVAAILLALWLRLDGLGRLSLWADEAFTWEDIHQPIAYLVGGRVNLHPPLYFLIERYGIRLFGENEYAFRFPGALLSVLAVPALYYLGRRLAGEPAGAVAALAIALAPVAVAYGREARMYGLLIATTALLLAAAEAVVRRPTRGRWLIYGLAAVAAGFTHFAALAALGAGALWTLRRLRGPGWLATHALVAAILGTWGALYWSNRDIWLIRTWLPWQTVYPLDQQVADWGTSVAGVPLGPVALAALLEPAFRSQLVLIGLLAAAVLAGLVALVARRRWLPAASLLVLGVGPLAAVVLLEPLRPMWHVRFTLVGLPALLLLAAGATALVRRPLALSVALGALAIAPQVYGLTHRPVDNRENWRAVATELRGQVRPGEVALGGLEAIADYYLRTILPVHQRPVALGRTPEVVVKELNERVGSAQAVWLVPASDSLLDRDDLVGSLLGRYSTERTEWTVGGVTVARIALRPHGPIALPSVHPIDATYGGAIHLVGYSAERGDGQVSLSLEGRIDRALPKDYKLFAHLLDGEGKTVAQHDLPVLDPAWQPTSRMAPGTRLRLEIEIRGPIDKLRAGRSIGVGFYDEATGARLTLEPARPENRLILPVAEAS